MTIANINVGTNPNDGTGDSLRTSFIKCNDNFSYLNSVFAGTGTISANSLTVTGNIILGSTLTFTPLGAAMQYGGNANAYVQMVMQNKSPLTNASTDFVATADNGSDSSYYVDLGIASSGYLYPGFEAILPNDSYLLANGGNLLLNAGSLSKTIKFAVDGSNTSNIVGQISNSAVSFTHTTISTSSTTGALQIAGGAGIAGNIYAGSALVSAGGALTTGAFTGTYSNGVIVDYTTGNGRISLGADDGLNIYNNGLATTPLVTIANTGNLVATGTITTSANISSSNLVLSAANATITTNSFQGFALAGIKAVTYTGNVTFGTNTTSLTTHLVSDTTSRAAIDVNANVTITLGGTIVAGVEKFIAVRNKSASTANIILPTSNNNKGTNVIPMAGGTVTSIWMLAADTTLANVIMTVVND